MSKVENLSKKMLENIHVDVSHRKIFEKSKMISSSARIFEVRTSDDFIKKIIFIKEKSKLSTSKDLTNLKIQNFPMRGFFTPAAAFFSFLVARAPRARYGRFYFGKCVLLIISLRMRYS